MSAPPSKFTINKDFARKFEHRKKRELLERKKELLNSSSSSSSSSLQEDENGELITDDLRFDFLKSLAKIKTKQPEIYKENTQLFGPGEENEIENNSGMKKTKENKKFTYGDMIREEILEKMQEMDETKPKVDIYKLNMLISSYVLFSKIFILNY
jgi:protein KRI1